MQIRVGKYNRNITQISNIGTLYVMLKSRHVLTDLDMKHIKGYLSDASSKIHGPRDVYEKAQEATEAANALVVELKKCLGKEMEE